MISLKPLLSIVAVTLTLLLTPTTTNGAYCNGSPDPNAPSNLNPTIQNPTYTLLKTVNNGLLYQANTETGVKHSFLVTHLYGTPYEKGLAHGQLLSDDINGFFTETFDYLLEELQSSLPSDLRFPEWFIDKVTQMGLDKALDWTYEQTKDYIDPDWLDELKGVSDGSGCDYQLMLRIHMLPEATKGACSMIGAYDGATATGNLLQLRALDWDTDGPFKDHANLIVYHNDGKPSWTNIAWSGFIGSVTGFNSEQMAISEIGVTYPDDTFGNESRQGIPFVNLLRDILEKDSTFEAADERVEEADRTCNLILGVGDAKTGQFNSIQYSADVANFITPDNFLPKNDTWHAPIDDVVYFGMDWLCPNYSEVLHDRLVENWGSLSPKVMIEDVIAITQTGNLHIAVYDLAQGSVYVSFMRKSTGDESDGEGLLAFERSFTHIDVDALFAVEQQ
jgi:hypothetical protein